MASWKQTRGWCVQLETSNLRNKSLICLIDGLPESKGLGVIIRGTSRRDHHEASTTLHITWPNSNTLTDY